MPSPPLIRSETTNPISTATESGVEASVNEYDASRLVAIAQQTCDYLEIAYTGRDPEDQVQTLCGSVMTHLRKPNTKPATSLWSRASHSACTIAKDLSRRISGKSAVKYKMKPSIRSELIVVGHAFHEQGQSLLEKETKKTSRWGSSTVRGDGASGVDRAARLDRILDDIAAFHKYGVALD